MKTFDPASMVRGYFIGDFEPTAYRTKDFEVSLMVHKQGEVWDAHYHTDSDEINYLMEGRMTINGELLEAPVIFVIEREEIADPEFLTDCKLIVVKTPSAPGDKRIVAKKELTDEVLQRQE
jgi:mannose-6-phosphate isomerase-like protein (cupin superfamily)